PGRRRQRADGMISARASPATPHGGTSSASTTIGLPRSPGSTIGSRMNQRYLRIGVLCLSVLFVGIQFIPVHRTNRLGAGDPVAPRDVQWILRRACYDCHSTESRWPIWAYVAPMSWRVVGDVERARKFVNFSDWQSLPPLYQQAIRQNILRVNASHKMPLWHYVTLHPDAKLSDNDRKILAQWAASGATQ